MCGPAAAAFLAPLIGGGATAAGATAFASTLATIGAGLSVGGNLIQGIQGYQAGREQAALIQQQRVTEAQLTAVQDTRERAQFREAMAQQRAELAASGVQLDSVTAMMLGQKAAQEMSFQSQATRATGMARQQELSAEQRAAQASALSSLLKGTFSAASSLITAAPDVWPGLLKKADT